MSKELRIKKGLVTFGLSRAIIIPSEWLKELGIVDGDQMYMELKGRTITIDKVPNDKV